MHCPVCNSVDLLITERQGIEIDYCPQCRGVWLDRGELDRLIERATERITREPNDRSEERREHVDDRSNDRNRDYGRKRRRSSFLGDLFDFG
jgi:Zn-finger nucleic acid-binding protein